MTEKPPPPGKGEFEVTLLGPGYGESIILHVGGGLWVVVDSCVDANGAPSALQYLESIGLNPSRDVALIVATHWHDDHIRGMSKLVATCENAVFCCASALCQQEFVAAVDALESRHLTVAGSGVREIHRVISRLSQAAARPTMAIANRRIFASGTCEIWSLSPDDAAFQDFLRSIGSLMPTGGQAKNRIPAVSPNELAVALWVRVGDVNVLLGSDLDKPGWMSILQSVARPTGRASVFKVPHHGSENAHEQDVWHKMLNLEPFAVLTPWRKGGKILPRPEDVRRIQSFTPNAYVTARLGSSWSAKSKASRRHSMVDKTVRESGVKFRQVSMSLGGVRLRRSISVPGRWHVEMLESSCHLKDFNPAIDSPLS